MGASNFLLIDGERIVTKALDRSYHQAARVAARGPAQRGARPVELDDRGLTPDRGERTRRRGQS
jgi:hypothetical protein